MGKTMSDNITFYILIFLLYLFHVFYFERTYCLAAVLQKFIILQLLFFS